MEEIDFQVSRTNLHDQIADALEKLILSPAMKVKEKLPSELELAKQFDVSRPVIREALKVLKERGLIVQKNGGGSYVSAPEKNTISNAVSRLMYMEKMDSDELHEMRMILEVAGIRGAAKHISDETLHSLQELVSQMNGGQLPLDQRVQKDCEFHIKIAQSSGNELLALFVEVMTTLLHMYMKKGAVVANGLQKAHIDHTAILTALASRDPDIAEKAMRIHLLASRASVTKFDNEGGFTSL